MCSAAEELRCVRCVIQALSWMEALDLSAECTNKLPLSFSALTSLSKPSLTVPANRARDDRVFDLAPLRALPSLQSVCVQCQDVGLKLSAGLSSLQKLTSLKLSATGSEWAEFDVNWRGMTALQFLTLSHWRFACNDKILQLSTLHNLPEVSFDNSRPVWDDADSSLISFHLMVHRLDNFCPKINLSTDEEVIRLVNL